MDIVGGSILKITALKQPIVTILDSFVLTTGTQLQHGKYYINEQNLVISILTNIYLNSSLSLHNMKYILQNNEYFNCFELFNSLAKVKQLLIIFLVNLSESKTWSFALAKTHFS